MIKGMTLIFIINSIRLSMKLINECLCRYFYFNKTCAYEGKVGSYQIKIIESPLNFKEKTPDF